MVRYWYHNIIHLSCVKVIIRKRISYFITRAGVSSKIERGCDSRITRGLMIGGEFEECAGKFEDTAQGSLRNARDSSRIPRGGVCGLRGE